ncbi:potassium channel subfamily K member 9-like [Watersipora subatra]|uniref:potassium channel subfamily K member 9-like n=1 Tax=Watersipora subatra TaxID=2589382 RepID=UPI00355B3BD7
MARQLHDHQFRKLAKSKQASSILIRVVTYILSTLGLLMMVVLYSIIGGFIFSWLEKDNEQKAKLSGREKIVALTYQTATEIYNTLEENAKAGGVLASRDNTLEFLENRTSQFFKDSWQLTKDGTWDGTRESDGEVVLDWTFTGALLFSVTTIATIGYGNIAPKTTTGRITCIFYSIFGLPITMLCVANIGIWFAQQVRLMHKKLSARCRKSTTTQVQEVPVLFSLLTMIAYVFLGTGIFSSWEGWSPIDATYFCFITLTTIGYGDIVPDVYKGGGSWTGNPSEQTFKLIVCGFYLFFGLALLAMCMDLMKEEVRANFLWLGQKAGLGTSRKRKVK